MNKNSLRKIRESLMISKTELARKADLSARTITRIEQGMPYRIKTKRKISLALGYKISDKEVSASVAKDNGDKRSGIDRRQFSYHEHVPERRSGKNRRNGFHRKTLKQRISEQ
jgi:DNA-binding XRE family transcriptional regulator